MRKEPVSVSVGVYIEEDGRLFLVEQKRGLWAPPAGHREDGETITDAVIREAKEETGYDIELLGLARVYTVQEESRFRMGFIFRGKIVSGDTSQKEENITNLRWFSREEVSSLLKEGKLYKPEYTERGLRDWLDGKLEPADVLCEYSI